MKRGNKRNRERNEQSEQREIAIQRNIGNEEK